MWHWFFFHHFEFNLFVFQCFISLILIAFSIDFGDITSLYFYVLEGFVIAFFPFNATLLRSSQTLTSSSPSSFPWIRLSKSTFLGMWPYNGFFFFFLENGEVQFLFFMYVSLFLDSNVFACNCISLLQYFACAYVFSCLVCSEFQKRAQSMSSLQTSLHPLRWHSSSLRMIMSLPIFSWRHCPHLLLAHALSIKLRWIF